ncbi:MAG: hypothetical protein H0T92_11750 [Pyrinomonadaceae bacterium]|nr:hypothetical protein [Pyrinomonadaceae bacterium]
MFKRLITLFIVLLFASQSLAGGFVCDGDEHKSAAEMSCCAQAKSAAGSPVAMLCCEIVCDEPTSGTPGPQSETAGQQPQVPAPPVAADSITTFYSLLPVGALKFKGSTDALSEDPDPPALYLHNSVFLI